MSTEQIPTPASDKEHAFSPKATGQVSVVMTSYEWSSLLHEIYNNLNVWNRDHTQKVRLYEIIATQLNDGHPVKLIHRDNPDPKYRPEEKVEAPKTQEVKTIPLSKWRGWWNKHFP